MRWFNRTSDSVQISFKDFKRLSEGKSVNLSGISIEFNNDVLRKLRFVNHTIKEMERKLAHLEAPSFEDVMNDLNKMVKKS